MTRFVLALCACSPTLGVHASDWTTAEAAAEILGLPIEPGRTVTVEMAEHAQTIDRHGCRRTVESPNEPVMLAHEMGHALGLEHVSDPGNLMAPFVGRDTVELSDEQHETLWSEVERLAPCGGR